MGFSSEKSSPQIEGGLESSADSNNNNRKWVIALRAPLKPIYTTITIPKKAPPQEEEEEEEEEECSSNSTATTPTGEEAKVPTRLTCPPAPRKQKAAPLKYCNNNSYAASPRDFFNPPDLETLFLPRQRA